jgi:carbamoyltransferase
MNIIGFSSFYHDSAAALINEQGIVAAAQEERFTRIKHDASFPSNAIQFCLEEAALRPDNIDYFVFYDKPFLKFERILESYLAFAPRGFKSFSMAMPVWLREKLFQKDLIRKELEEFEPNRNWEKKLLFAEHHQSHAASAFYPSPFQEAVILTMDGVGEWATTSTAIGRGNELDIIKEIHFPHSLGLLYSAFTYFTGFKVNSGEYKVMGLAPYGEPRFASTILENIIDLKDDGSFRLNMDYFDYCTDLHMTNKRLEDLLGVSRRLSEQKLEQVHMDLAASIQMVTEEAVLRLTRSLAKETGQSNLCLAGGVALNCVANGKVLLDGAFDNIWIQPAAGDAGGALGAALTAWYRFQKKPRKINDKRDSMRGSYLGPVFSQQEIESRLDNCGAKYHVLDSDKLIMETAKLLANEKAVGWFQGRMEFGPRALGGRSILGDPRSPSMQKNLNLKVKYRESFRPFAPSVLAENANDWFSIESSSPYMLIVANVQPSHCHDKTDEEQQLSGLDKLYSIRSDIPAVTHIDYSARVQTVHMDTNPRYYALLAAFKEITNCPVLVNTSFNVRGEPIVCTPDDAFKCFMGTELDALAIGNCLLLKSEQDAVLKEDYKNAFKLD